MRNRGQNFTAAPLNIVGSSIFGRYPKISIEKTYNMFVSDNALVPYAGYQIAIPSANFSAGTSGRGIFSSAKLNKMVVVIDENVFLVSVTYNQQTKSVQFSQVIFIGSLQTATGVVYITENNASQILISDSVSLYLYDATLSPTFRTLTIDFTPGYITFHDTYFIAAARNTNTWRLSGQNNGLLWASDSASVGLIQTKPDQVQAVVRFPSKGNMIFVMGSIVTEAWFDTGAQLFPYQRNNQFNIDYGCISPATVAYLDEIVVWLAQNEKSGPIILMCDGGMPKKITTDGIDFLFSQLQTPQDSQAFLYRQDGHLFYHINFYSDNISLFYDVYNDKFYHASDQNLNYFIAAEVAFYGNQYYFVTKNNGNMFSFDTRFTTYQDVLPNGTVFTTEIPRFRSCKHIRKADQSYFIANDVSFTIESGETNYQHQLVADRDLITQDGNFIITQDGNFILLNNTGVVNTLPRVDLSISIDGGASFGSDMPYVMNAIGKRKNQIEWWQCGIANDFTCLFKFWGIGRFVAFDGVVMTRE